MTEKHKRFLLGAVLAGGAIYSYMAILVSPALAETARLRRELEVCRQRVTAASAELKKLQASERDALAKANLDQSARELLGSMPTPFMVTTIPMMDRVLEEHEMPAAKVKLFMMMPFRELPEFAIATWDLDVPEGHALRIGEVLAELENRFPLGRLAQLQFDAQGATGTVNASIHFQTAVRP